MCVRSNILELIWEWKFHSKYGTKEWKMMGFWVSVLPKSVNFGTLGTDIQEYNDVSWFRRHQLVYYVTV